MRVVVEGRVFYPQKIYVQTVRAESVTKHAGTGAGAGVSITPGVLRYVRYLGTVPS